MGRGSSILPELQSQLQVAKALQLGISALAKNRSNATQEPFDCDSAFANWKSDWSEAKMLYCCHHHDRGCIGVDYQGKHHDRDCKVGLSHWETEWSMEKKSYCCKTKQFCVTELHAENVYLEHDGSGNHPPAAVTPQA